MNYTFLIINKNGGDTLARCLQSINALKLTSSEIILVDDNSSDASTAIADNFVDKIISNKRSIGIGKSRNKGIKVAKGRFIFIIDSDITIKNLDIDEIERYFENSTLAAMSGYYSGETNTTDWNTALDVRRKYIFDKDIEPKLTTLDNYTTFSGGFCVIDKSKIGTLKFRKENGYSGEDLIFQIDLLNRDLKTLYLPSFEGTHYHLRTGKNVLKKIISEANGAYWVAAECSSPEIRVPYLEFALNFPTLLLLALISPYFWLSALLISIEFFPYATILFKEKMSFASLKLFVLAIMVYVYRIPLLFYWIFTQKYSIRDKRFLLPFILKSDILSKYRFIKYRL